MPCYYDDNGELYCTEDFDNPADAPMFQQPGNFDLPNDFAVTETPGMIRDSAGNLLDFKSYNLPDDYAVTEKGLIRDQAGNLGKFENGQWKPYEGGDINAFLGKPTGSWGDLLKGLGGAAKNFATSKAGMAGLLALLNYLDRQKPTRSGGGTPLAYTGPAKQLTPTTVQGKYGPLVQYAANGGLMQAYANGGKVQMEDGGFVMTKKAVDGAGGPRGIQQLVPGARMIRGPGTGTSDDIPAVINGRNGQTPARLSNGEAYVPPGRDTKGLYALMHRLERNA